MGKVFKPKPSKPSWLRRATDFLRSNPWLVTSVISVATILTTRYQLGRDRLVSVRAECRSADPLTPPTVRFERERDRAMVGFRAHCTIRNVGARTTDLVEIRNGLSWQGKALRANESLFAVSFEEAFDVVVNGEPFTRPVTLQPGAAASVDATVSFPVDGFESPDALAKLRACAAAHPASAGEKAPKACLAALGVGWTDYMRGAGRRRNVETETSFADGMGVNFYLSDDSFVFAELPFHYGWGWSCRGDHLRPLPKYLRENFCKHDHPNPASAASSGQK